MCLYIFFNVIFVRLCVFMFFLFVYLIFYCSPESSHNFCFQTFIVINNFFSPTFILDDLYMLLCLGVCMCL